MSRAAIKTVMETDGTLMGILSGGVHTAAEITRQATPTAFDANKEILTCALVKGGNENPTGPTRLGGRWLINIFFYSQTDDAIEAAMVRTKSLLDRQKIGSGTWECQWAGDSSGIEDATLLCPMGVSRYELVRYRG